MTQFLRALVALSKSLASFPTNTQQFTTVILVREVLTPSSVSLQHQECMWGSHIHQQNTHTNEIKIIFLKRAKVKAICPYQYYVLRVNNCPEVFSGHNLNHSTDRNCVNQCSCTGVFNSLLSSCLHPRAATGMFPGTASWNLFKYSLRYTFVCHLFYLA